MDLQYLINQLVSRDLKRCEQLYDKLTSQSPELPEGSIVLKRGQPYRTIRENGQQLFAMLTADEPDLLHDIKFKRYIKKALPILKRRIAANRTFLQRNTIYDPIQMEATLPIQYNGLADLDIFLDGDISPEEWKSAEYEQNTIPINVPHVTSGGLITRSKSEEIIGTRLEDHGFIFRYEPVISLSQKNACPDFAILLPNKRRIVYWEHLGMIDDPEYVLRNLEKIDQYAKYGIYLGINLIITYETRDNPLTVKEVDKRIRQLNHMDKK